MVSTECDCINNIGCPGSSVFNEIRAIVWLLLHIWATSWKNQQSDCAPSEDSDQPGRPPSLIRVFAVCMKKGWVLGYPLSAQRRLWSDWADDQADLNFHWMHSHFVGFIMRLLNYVAYHLGENQQIHSVLKCCFCFCRRKPFMEISSVWWESDRRFWTAQKEMLTAWLWLVCSRMLCSSWPPVPATWRSIWNQLLTPSREVWTILRLSVK